MSGPEQIVEAIISLQTVALTTISIPNTWLLLSMEAASESVSETLCYKQRAEKSTGAEMVLMKWSPVADLLAAAFSDRSVSVLFWYPCSCLKLSTDLLHIKFVCSSWVQL